MILNDAQLQVIRTVTLEQYPKEAVIAITETGVVILENLHPTPEEHFRVDAKVFSELGAVALVHSHPVQKDQQFPQDGSYYDPRTPSPADMQTQVRLDIPFGILSTDGVETSPIIWFPDVDGPLLGREFVHGVTDCYRLIRAYYWQDHQILLPDYPRDYHWWEKGDNLYANNVYQAGFEDVPAGEQPQIGDMGLMRLNSDEENHGLIYIGNDQIMHHLNNRLSIVDSYSKWSRKITRFLRHKDAKCNS